MIQIVDTITAWLAQHGLNILGAIGVFVIGRIVARKLTNLLGNILTQNKIDTTLTSFFKNFSYLALMAGVLITALNLLGFETSSIIDFMELLMPSPVLALSSKYGMV